MKRTHLIQLIALFAIIALLGFLGLRNVILTDPSASPEESVSVKHEPPLSEETSEVKVDSAASNGNAEGIDPWKVYYDQFMDSVIKRYRAEGILLTAEMEAEFRKGLLAAIDQMKANSLPIPDSPTPSTVFYQPPTEKEKEVAMFGKAHEGAQTVQAIMEAFDSMFEMSLDAHDRSLLPHDESAYPREEWIQKFLDHGAEFRHYRDYDMCLKLRSNLVFFRGKQLTSDSVSLSPAVKEYYEAVKEYYGVSSDATFEEFESGFIKKRLQEWEDLKQLERSDPSVSGAFGTKNGLIPMRKDTLYVRVDKEGFGAKVYGKSFSEEDEYKLIFHGIVPDGQQVVYLDEFDKTLPSDAKPRLSWAEYFNQMSEKEWRKTADITLNGYPWDSPETEKWTALDWMTHLDQVEAIYKTASRWTENAPVPSAGPDASPPASADMIQAVPSLKDAIPPSESERKSGEAPPLPPAPDLKRLEQMSVLFEAAVQSGQLPEQLSVEMRHKLEEYRRQAEEALKRQEEEEKIRRSNESESD